MIKRIIILLCFIVACTVGATVLFYNEYQLVAIIISFIDCLCIAALLVEYNKNLKKLIFMLNAIESDDFSFHFDNKNSGNTQQLFNATLNRIKRILEIEKENIRQRERYYETLLNSANIGVMVIDNKGFVHYCNDKILQITKLSVLTHVEQIHQLNTSFAEIIKNYEGHETQKTVFFDGFKKITVSISCTPINLHEKPFKIIAVSDISNETEATEVETWTQLIRVMTHEIMNSIAPIASLSELLSQSETTNLETKKGLEVINKTTLGLISFVDSYRTLTHAPQAIKKSILVSDILQRVITLTQDEMRLAQLECNTRFDDDYIMIYADENQISRVIINLIHNAIQANAHHLEISTKVDVHESVSITFSNDGKPISDDNINKIFLPFYTTKSIGSGIGLSVSRQIMQQHHGSIQLIRSNEKETVFALIFK